MTVAVCFFEQQCPVILRTQKLPSDNAKETLRTEWAFSRDKRLPLRLFTLLLNVNRALSEGEDS